MQQNFENMRIIDEIKKRFYKVSDVLLWNKSGFFSRWDICNYNFATLLWYNICDLLTDLIEDVRIVDKTNAPSFSDNGQKFAAFRSFVYAWGKMILQRLYDDGYVVIGYDDTTFRFWVLKSNEYREEQDGDITFIAPKDPNIQRYVMKSASFLIYNKSDKELCNSWLDFLNDVLNGSATVSKRLGAVVIASPKNLTNAPTATVLTDEQKKKIEEEMRKDYGALSNQSNIMLLPREMSWQTINLAGLDLKMQEKVKIAILAIVDRIKIPANQVAIIDAQSSKQLANGSEIREGDKLKYKSFRRLFERTFADMAREFGLRIDYIIDGEPIGENAEVIA